MPAPESKLALMVQPEALKSDDYQPWSRGRGVDVWAMICACITGDLQTIKRLVARDANLVNCEYEYFKPIHFAVREAQRAIVDFLLEKGADPADEAGNSLVGIARERGHLDLAAMLQQLLRQRFQIVPEMGEVVAAIKARELNTIKTLLGSRPELINAADERGNRPIHWAVMTRQLSLIDYLLEHGADINAKRPDSIRALHLTNGDYHYRGWRDVPQTALQNHEILIGYLLARGAEYDISTATKIGDLDRVRELLDKDPALVNRVPTYSYYTGLPLRNAAAAGHIAVVKLLLERGANPNEPEPGIAPDGGALHAAIGATHWEIVKLLLEHGSNPNAAVESSGNCLSRAKHVGAPKGIVDLIASFGGVMGADLADVETLAAMLHANPNLNLGEKVDDPLFRRLIVQHQPDILKHSPDPTPWWSFAVSPDPEAAKWALRHGLDPNRRNWLGITVLHRCAAKGEIEVAQVFLEAGADINALESEWSSTPLSWAVREKKIEMAEWLLSKGANPGLPEDEPWALPISWAKRRGDENILRLLKTSSKPV